METLGDKILPKFCSEINKKFACELCDYNTSKKSSYETHLLSAKHKKQALGDKGDTNSAFLLLSEKNLICENCNKKYSSRNGLWKHKKTCLIQKTNENLTDKDLILLLLKQHTKIVEQNSELLEVIKHGTNNNNNNTTHTNSHNKTFNLQFFLNETCKDAMNIMDFVDSIKLQISDLEKVGEYGFVEGISSIITNNLNALDVSQRPIHCADKKREVLYIKDENKWEKEDDDKKRLRKAIKKIVSKNQRLLPVYKQEHPDCVKSTSIYSDQYNKMIIESMGGIGNNDLEKEDKIIKKITKEVVIDKT
jgi:hypothetical protein